MISGPRLARTAVLRTSITATTNMTRNAVPTIWSMNGPPHPPWKYGAGKVAKIEKVTLPCGPVLVAPRASLNALIASW